MYSIRYEGFTSKFYTWNNCKINNQDKLINTFNNYGCIIIPNILCDKDCDAILKIISEEERIKNHETSEINSNYKRKDLMLPTKKMRYYIKKIYKKIEKFCDIIIPGAKIVECSSLISYPGCYPQIWHADTNYTSKTEGNLVSFGIALDKTTPNMGPLEVYLQSNKIYKSKINLFDKYGVEGDDLQGDYDDGMKKQSTEILCNKLNLQKGNCSCKKGSLVIWSSKVIHRGGKNTHKKRPVFYFSLLGKGKKPYGATYSLKTNNNIEYIKKI
jgi:hypothetical protein